MAEAIMKSGLNTVVMCASLLLLTPVVSGAQVRGGVRDTAMARQHAQHVAAACGDKRGDEKLACERSFLAMQQRGEHAMGVDQYTSRHVFDSLADGGRIELQADPADTAAVEPVREHLREIAEAFSRGDFATPGFVHDQDVPGTEIMKERRSSIRYEFRALPRGGEVIIRTSDRAALRAIHEFLAFQRQEHRAGGHRQ
jgi:hypothetical protein